MNENNTTFVRTKLIRGKEHFFVTRDKKLGGEWMKETEPEMVFVDSKEIPARATRTSGFWQEYLAKIPVGKALVLTEKTSKHKLETVIQAVLSVNKLLKKIQYHTSQRTVNGIKTLYIENLGK